MTPKPGRELDALVAEKVMGLVKGTGMYSFIVQGPFEDCDCPSHDAAGVMPYYSTDIAAVWEVVEKLLGLGYALELYSPGALINDEFGTHSVGWGAEFCTWGEPYLRSGRVGETVCHTMDEKSGGAAIETTPHAICLAALKAVE